jgi:lipoprotein-anchoring transpeptidase ErfK/SrfK
MKRLALAMGIVLVLLVGPGSAAAADGGADIQIVTVSFAPLNSTTCPNLSEGTSITWTGPLTSITRTRTDAGGITTVSNMSHASGVATDQDGNQYAFNYSNSFRVSNSIDDPGTFTGTMTDSFSLAGNGPARLHNGFIAGLTTDLATFFAFDSVHSRGDPIDFDTVAAHCDPL